MFNYFDSYLGDIENKKELQGKLFLVLDSGFSPMNNPTFCPNCGANLSPGMRFCESCGFPIASILDPPSFLGPPSAPLSPPPLGVNKVVSHKRSRIPWIPFLLFFSAIILSGGLWSLGWLNPTFWSQWIAKTLPTNIGSSVVTSPNPTIAPVDANAVSLQDFVGVWMAMEGDPGSGRETFITMGLEENIIVADIEGDRLELPVLNGRRLEGNLRQDGVTIPITAELNQDKQQITFIARPPNSELQVAVGMKVEGIDDLPNNSDSMANSPNLSGTILSEQEALDRLLAQPEIANWMEQVQREAPLNQTLLEIVETTPEQYLIRAYESVNNPGEPGHTATFGWYNINRQTGEVTTAMP